MSGLAALKYKQRMQRMAAEQDKSIDSNSAINPQFDKSDGDSEDLSDYGSDQEAKYRGKIRKEKKQ